MMKVLIVGGGIAGVVLANNLQKKNIAKILLVEPKGYLEVPYAQLRALVEPNTFSPLIRENYSTLLPEIKHIQKRATGVKEGTLTLDDGTQESFDFLVIASGSSFANWSYLKSEETDIGKRQEGVKKESSKLEKANSVLIVGGGSVGVELAGEIADKWPDKKITIVTSSSRVLSGLNEKV
jgi:NADH dehydrogenase FAD-containing subunit